ncbi:hypothetical protein V1477_005946, partial [Vespula maculifrons]
AAPESLPSPQNTAAAAAVAAAADAADAVAAAAAAAAMWQHQQERLTGDARSSPNSYETNNDDAKETMWKPRGVADAPSVPYLSYYFLLTIRSTEFLEDPGCNCVTFGRHECISSKREVRVTKIQRNPKQLAKPIGNCVPHCDYYELPIPYPPSIIPSGVPQTSVPQMLRYNLYNCEEISIKNGGNNPTEKCLLVDLSCRVPSRVSVCVRFVSLLTSQSKEGQRRDDLVVESCVSVSER